MQSSRALHRFGKPLQQRQNLHAFAFSVYYPSCSPSFLLPVSVFWLPQNEGVYPLLHPSNWGSVVVFFTPHYVNLEEPVNNYCPSTLPHFDIDIQYIARGGVSIYVFPSVGKPVFIWLSSCPSARYKGNEILLDKLLDVTIK